MNNGNRVILNTGFLYANMVVNICVQLVSVRILFNSFGLVDYGIYNIVAGIVALFAFMNVAMSAATQRFLSFAIGMGDKENLKELFYQSIVLHICIALLFVLCMEIGGSYYVYHILKAPAERIYAAEVLLHCITASTFVNIIMVPYEADINANEDMGAIAMINILDSLMKLGVACVVSAILWDRLKTFGCLTVVCLLITLFLKRSYCRRKYPESHFRWHKIQDYSQMREIASFAGWNLMGSGCGIARYQGTAVILNYFFGVLINAAYGVAQQVNALMVFFANTIVRAIRPQVVKSEGMGDRERMLRLSVTTCKITSLMVALMAVPLFVEMPLVLELWLGKEPDPTCVLFCKCFLIIVFINQLTIGLQIAIESTGRIWMLQLVVGLMHIVALPLGWVLFRMGFPPATILYCVIGEELLALFVRSWIAHWQVKLNVGHFLSRDVMPCLLFVGMITFGIKYGASMLSVSQWLHVLVVSLISVLSVGLVAYSLLMNDRERQAIRQFIQLVSVKLGMAGKV